MSLTRRIAAVAASVTLLTGIGLVAAAPASAADHQPPSCIFLVSQSKHSVVVGSNCTKAYRVKAIFKWGKDVTQYMPGFTRYRLTSGSLSSFERLVVVY